VAERLQSRLGELAREVDYPPTPDLAAAVRDRIAADAGAGRAPRLRRPLLSRRALALAVSLALLGTAGAAAAVPGVRHAIGNLLGLRGATVERVPRTPRTPAAAGRDLGPRVTFAEAGRRAGFRILVAHDKRLGEPDSVHASGTRITLVYRGADVTLTQVPGSAVRDLVRKLTPPQTTIHRVLVRGEPGLYIDGPHVVMYRDASGQVVADRARRAGRVLLWQRGPLLLRLEADVSQARALAIARSVR
jgi:hypothetical protein